MPPSKTKKVAKPRPKEKGPAKSTRENKAQERAAKPKRGKKTSRGK